MQLLSTLVLHHSTLAQEFAYSKGMALLGDSRVGAENLLCNP